MTENEAKYVTALGDAFLVAARMHKGNTAAEIYDALRDGVRENYHTVGTMAGLVHAVTIEAVDTLVGRRCLSIEPGGIRVSLLDAGARWYMAVVLGIEPPAAR